LVQVWGPRYTAYLVAARDLAVFTLGRMPDGAAGRRRAEEAAARLREFLRGRRMGYGDVGDALGIDPNALRYGATTGTVLIRWDGARLPVVGPAPAPEVEPRAARLELARRSLHVFGPTTDASFAEWAGIAPRAGQAAFDALQRSLIPVRTPVGDAWILARDEGDLRARVAPALARLLPSGDPFFLLQGADRELLIPDADHRRALWTSRVWPGAVIVDGEIAGTWRRAGATITVQPWRRLRRETRQAVEAEARTLPLPRITGSAA